MADAAMLSWSTLAAPVVSGAFTALTTGIIVFGANWLTRKSIEASNEKSLDEVKSTFEISQKHQMALEKRRLAAQERAEWEKALNQHVSEFAAAVEEYDYLTRDYVSFVQKSKRLKVNSQYLEELGEKDRVVSVRIAQLKSLVFNLLRDDIEVHGDLISEIQSILGNSYDQRKKAQSACWKLDMTFSHQMGVFFREGLKNNGQSLESKHMAAMARLKDEVSECREFWDDFRLGVSDELYGLVERVMYEGKCSEVPLPPVDTNP